MAVTLRSSSPTGRRSRTRSAPENIRTYAIRSPAGPSLDLEDGARRRAVGVTLGGGQQLRDAAHEHVHAGAGDGRAEEHGMDDAALRLRRKLRAKPVVGDALVLDVRVEDRLVALGKHLGEPIAKLGAARGSHRDDRRRQPLRDRLRDPFAVRSATVRLVHEQQRRDAQPLQRPHEQRRLRLHAFDCGDHEHGAVEHAQHALHLGDEVRVAGRVDQVDGDVVDRERDDRRLDGDPALPFQRERVRLRAAVVDAADLVDDAGRVQQPLCERCLTGVYMRQDSQVERSSKHGSYPPK